MLRTLLRRLLHMLTYLSGEGSWELHSHEKIVLDAVVDHLDERLRRLIREQLEQSFFVERIPDGRINVFRFYRMNDELVVPDAEFDDLLFRIHLMVNGRKQIAHVTFYKGQVFSVEMKKRGRFYKGADLKVEQVTLGNPKQTYTRAIDRLEHGSEGA